MKIFEESELDVFLELPLDASSLIEIDNEYTCVHDDSEGHKDQCLKITLKEDSSGNEIFHLKIPTATGLRFRNYIGGGSSLQVHNALKVLIYANFNNIEYLPGLEREMPSKINLDKIIEDMLKGEIVLPSKVFAEGNRHYFFEIAPNLKVAISIDGDTHIFTKPTTDIKEQIRGETTFWNPEPLTFCLNYDCTRAIYNALILLTIAVKQNRK
jgi:hypothetical protein